MSPCGHIASRRSAGLPGRSAAFTLVELLIVIAILGLLIALLVPSLSRARLLAVRAVCQGNLHALGRGAALYQGDHGEFVPVCWANISGDRQHQWKSWRANLLPYAPGYEAFNCPAAEDRGVKAERFHSAAEILWHENTDTVNAGSYGVMYQNALPGYNPVNYTGIEARGHPMWSNEFSTVPGVSWRRPGESVYVADAVLLSGPITYPSGASHKGYGTSVIMPPSDPGYASGALTRRFADRHAGTACLFVDGHTVVYETKKLDEMAPGQPGCVWDVE